MKNENQNALDNNINSDQKNTPEPTLDKSKFGALQVLTAAQIVTLLVKSDSTFAGPCGY